MNELIAQINTLYQQYLQDRNLENYRQAAGPLYQQLYQDNTVPLSALQSLISVSPDTIQAAQQSRDQQEFAQRMQQMYGAAQGLVDLTQLINSFGQIRTADRAAQTAVMPTPPPAPPPSTQLSEELYSAQRRAGDIGYAINPATQQLNQAYTQALGQAQAASGGQASNYQALANLANQQRMQAALQLVPMAQQARMENQQLTNQLLGQRLQEQQRGFENQMAAYPYQFDVFTRRQDAIGALGSQGRSYAFDAISRLPEYLQYLPYDDDSNNFIRDTWSRYDRQLGNRYGLPTATVEDELNMAQMLNRAQPFKYEDKMQFNFNR